MSHEVVVIDKSLANVGVSGCCGANGGQVSGYNVRVIGSSGSSRLTE